MYKKQKNTAISLILVGISLASIACQTATNVSAEGSILGSIKNFFNKSKSKTKDEVPLKLQKDTLEHTLFEKARNNLKNRIKEDMLNKQYTLKEFEEMVKDDEKCSEFVRQLLVLDRITDYYHMESYKLIDNGELKKAKETLKKLFLKIDSADKIKELIKLPLRKKEKFLKVIVPLFNWTLGTMPSLFGERDYLSSQNDKELHSKICLLRNVLHKRTCICRLSLYANEFVDFICRCDNSLEKKAYTAEYCKYSFLHDVKEDLAEDLADSNLKDKINSSLLLNSAKSLFKNLKNFDLLKFDNHEEDARKLAAKEFYSKFEDENLRDSVFEAIERYLKERVEDYETEKFSNREGGKESLKERMEYVKEYLSSQQEKDSSL